MTLATPQRAVRTEPPRDRWTRPLVYQLDPAGNVTSDLVAYTRASTLGKAVADASTLAAWKCRNVAYGMAGRPDLVARAATADPADRAALTEVVDAALEVAAASSAARIGTAVHAGTETVDLGGTLDQVPAVVRDQVAAYVEVTAPLHVLDVEFFVVNDDLCAAGTPDRLYQLPDGRVVIGDLKTGGPDAPKYGAGEWAVQLAVYATGRRYDPETGRRSLIHPQLDTTTGVIAHVPARGGTPALYALNLAWGLEAARLANRVRGFRKARFHQPLDLGETRG